MAAAGGGIGGRALAAAAQSSAQLRCLAFWRGVINSLPEYMEEHDNRKFINDG